MSLAFITKNTTFCPFLSLTTVPSIVLPSTSSSKVFSVSFIFTNPSVSIVIYNFVSETEEGPPTFVPGTYAVVSAAVLIDELDEGPPTFIPAGGGTRSILINACASGFSYFNILECLLSNSVCCSIISSSVVKSDIFFTSVT